MRGPCKGCTDRHEACHDTCERYKAWKIEHDASREWMRQMTLSVTSKGAERAFREKCRSRRR